MSWAVVVSSDSARPPLLYLSTLVFKSATVHCTTRVLSYERIYCTFDEPLREKKFQSLLADKLALKSALISYSTDAVISILIRLPDDWQMVINRNRQPGSPAQEFQY